MVILEVKEKKNVKKEGVTTKLPTSQLLTVQDNHFACLPNGQICKFS